MPKLILISDTHGYTPGLPKGDILIHAGDLTGNGSVKQCQRMLDWLNVQPHTHIVTVAGNHDFAFQEHKHKLNFGRVIYLENEERTIEGLRIYGSPITPQFMDWAFMVPRGEAIRNVWDEIPSGLDILVTHGPPMGILDQANPAGVFYSEHLGCEELAFAVARVKPRLHVFGHIHGGYGYKNFNGTEFFNASMVSDAYRLAHDAWEIYFETEVEVAAPIPVESTTENDDGEKQ
jgi:Icc-related predicted phosphoesterase